MKRLYFENFFKKNNVIFFLIALFLFTPTAVFSAPAKSCLDTVKEGLQVRSTHTCNLTDEQIQTLMHIGESYLNAFQTEKAQRLFLSLYSHQANRADVVKNLARAYQNEPGLAEKYWRLAMNLDLKDPEPPFFIGEIHHDREEADAMDWTQEAENLLKARYGDPSLAWMKGKIAERQGKLDSAEITYKSLAITGQAEALQNLAEFYLNYKEYEKALRALNKVKITDYRSSLTMTERQLWKRQFALQYRLLKETENTDSLQPLLNEAFSLFPNDPTLKMDQALLFEKRGRYRDAYRVWESLEDRMSRVAVQHEIGLLPLIRSSFDTGFEHFEFGSELRTRQNAAIGWEGQNGWNAKLFWDNTKLTSTTTTGSAFISNLGVQGGIKLKNLTIDLETALQASQRFRYATDLRYTRENGYFRGRADWQSPWQDALLPAKLQGTFNMMQLEGGLSPFPNWTISGNYVKRSFQFAGVYFGGDIRSGAEVSYKLASVKNDASPDWLRSWSLGLRSEYAVSIETDPSILDLQDKSQPQYVISDFNWLIGKFNLNQRFFYGRDPYLNLKVGDLYGASWNGWYHINQSWWATMELEYTSQNRSLVELGTAWTVSFGLRSIM